MFKFSEFTNESLKEYYISFEYNGEKIEFKSTIFRKIYTDTILWLYNNGYKFDENVVGRKLYKKSEISKSYLNKGLLYQIPNEDLYMIVNVGNEQSIKYAILMLKRFGVKSNTIDTNCLKSSNDSDLDETDEVEIKNDDTQKMTFIEAAQVILKSNNNKPMTSLEIWKEANLKKLVETLGKTPWDTMNSQMILYSDNSNAKGKKKKSIFRIIEGRPYKFILLNPNSEVQSEEDFEEIPNVYCVRAGVANKDANIFLEGGFVGINYDTQGFDLSVKTKEEIIELLSSRDSSKRAIQQYIQQIELFKEIQDGDIILVPDSDGTNIGEVSSDMYLAEGEYPNRINVEWLGKIEKNSSLNIPKTVFKVNNFNTDDLKFTNTESNDVDDIETFSTRFGMPTDFKAVQAQEEKGESVVNPFKQSICILGSSGKGKSTTVELMLEKFEKSKDSEFEFIIPTSSTTGLLSQYSPKGKYIKSRLGRMIMTAHEHPEKMVTAVFDECHKSAVIEMINDELLQCISTRRNMGRRFISVDEETEELYPGLAKHRGNLLIPNNFGFIFLSSKPDVIIQNSDFFNRVDIYVLTEQPPEGADLSLNYDEKENVILPEYFTKIEGKSKEDEDRIKSLYNNIKS